MIPSLKCLIEKVSEATEVVLGVIIRYRHLTIIDKTNIVFYRYVSSIIGIYPDRIVKKGPIYRQSTINSDICL